MKLKVLFLAITCIAIGACDSPPTVSKKPIEKGAVSDRQKETVAAHSVDKQEAAKKATGAETVEKSNKKTKWTRSGNPIDTRKFDREIEAAEKALKAEAGDSAKKALLATAYFNRGFALTEARQYASAIGDYRRALKQVPDHAESKKWIAMIASIYKSINREVPAVGEEPKPLEFKSQNAN